MKGVVMEIRQTEAVVLSDDGIFSKIKNCGYSVGQTVVFKQMNKSRIIAFASAAAAALVITFGGFTYYTPTTYVSLDVNPSIAFSLNRYNRVLSAEPVNEDAKAILDGLNLKNESIEKAVEQTIDKLIDQGYIAQDDNGGVIIAASNADGDKAQSLANQLKVKAQSTIDEQGKVATVESISAGKDLVERAKQLGVTPGKLNLVDKLKESSVNPDQVDESEWLNKPVKEINKTIKENQQTKKDNDGIGGTGSTTAGSGQSEVTTDGSAGNGTSLTDDKGNAGSVRNDTGTTKDNGQPETRTNNGNDQETSKENPGNTKRNEPTTLKTTITKPTTAKTTNVNDNSHNKK